MTRSQTLILHFFLAAKPLAYPVIFVGMMIEGDIFLFTTAFLTSAGFFELWKVALVAVAGALIGDLIWFWLGQRFMNSSELIQRWADRVASPFDAHLRDRPFHTIFLSKFVYGLHRLLLARAGNSGMKFDLFVRLDLVAITLWMLAVGGLGYFSGASIQLIRHYLKFTEVALGLGLVFFLALQFAASALTRRKL